MRVAIVAAVFPPEPLTSALGAYDLAVELTERKHQVTVFTAFPNRPQGRVFDGYSRRLVATERTARFDVVRTWHTLSRHSTMLSRFAENVSFGVSSSIAALARGPFDVAYIGSWPIFAQNLSAAALGLRGIPCVCGVGDLYPETLTGKGLVSPASFLAAAMLRLDKLFLSRCTAVVAISDEMRDYLVQTRGLQKDRVHTVPNWLDFQPFCRETSSVAQAKARLGIPPDRFVVMFAGAITMSAGVGLYLDAAERLASSHAIELVIVGEGSTREWVEQQVRRRRLSNVRLVRGLRPENVPSTQAASDVLLLSLTGDSRYIAVPSKLIAYMFSAKPVVACVTPTSTAARIVSEAGCGVVVEPDRADLLARALERLAQLPQPEREALGSRGRAYAIRRFSRDALVPALADLIERAAGCATSKPR